MSAPQIGAPAQGIGAPARGIRAPARATVAFPALNLYCTAKFQHQDMSHDRAA
jgi:hypothetical protein